MATMRQYDKDNATVRQFDCDSEIVRLRQCENTIPTVRQRDIRERGTGVWFHRDVPGTDQRVRRQEVRGRTDSGLVSGLYYMSHSVDFYDTKVRHRPRYNRGVDRVQRWADSKLLCEGVVDNSGVHRRHIWRSTNV
ncbi:hypothetical protein DPMN_158508 [Dreissena polymorpha]|uniref:Uncharacterized protein n=1 Tax=Dreissena polymorpha TaxID=45954 RepID=A0A9D4EJY6_DREPO|nr:hypothetical protein DPMN_158508 [Dreissena polymorpha]